MGTLYYNNISDYIILVICFYSSISVDCVKNVDTIIKLIQGIKHAVTHGSAKSMGSAVS